MIWVYVMILLLILTIVVTIFTVYWVNKKKKEGTNQEPNYYTFFILGICFLPLGSLTFTTGNPGMMGLTALGIIYMSIGLSHRDTWEKDKLRLKKK
jgi:flagellar basal body-associated protein FliL